MKKHHSHDNVFREIEQVKENAADFISSTFPADLLEKLDLDSLVLDSESYVDEKLSESFSDLVYRCDFADGEVNICLLFEHKSYQPKYVELQLLKYMLNIWERQIKNKKPLKNIIPVVFYHGKKKWKKRNFEDMFESRDELLLSFLPRFRFLLTDLHDFSDEFIREEAFKRDINKALMLLFKHIFDEKYLREHLYAIFSILNRRFEEEESRQMIFALLTYLFNHVEYISFTDIQKSLNTTTEKGREVIMTLAEKIREEGVQQGLERGIQQGVRQGVQQGVRQGLRQGVKEGKLEDARIMIMKGFDVKDIADITGLSVEEIKSLKS